MNKKNYWLILLNPIIIGIYGIGLYVLYRFLWLGNVKKRVPILCLIFGVLCFWFIIWTFYYHQHKDKIKNKNFQYSYLLFNIELIIILLMTCYSGYRIYQIAQPFTGKLGNYLYERQNSQEVLLIHHNYLKTGIDGIMEDIDSAVDLPQDIYVSNYLEVVYDDDGTIQKIYSFLYGKDDAGKTRTYLVDYDIQKSKKIKIYLDGYSKTTYASSQKLTAMKKTSTIDQNGYHHDKWTRDSVLVDQEKQQEVTHDKPGQMTKDQNGNVRFCLEKDVVYSFNVVDSALGTRYYSFTGLDFTNPDPFEGKGGVVQELYFSDQYHGYVILSNASGERQTKYITNDGGHTFVSQ